jgi:hypothetical protein
MSKLEIGLWKIELFIGVSRRCRNLRKAPETEDNLQGPVAHSDLYDLVPENSASGHDTRSPGTAVTTPVPMLQLGKYLVKLLADSRMAREPVTVVG